MNDTLKLDVIRCLKNPNNPAKPWKTARFVAGQLRGRISRSQVSDILEEEWRHGNAAEIRPSYYPSKTTLEVLWAATCIVGTQPRQTDIRKVDDEAEKGWEDAPDHRQLQPYCGPNVFFSHSHSDEERALKLRDHLGQHNYNLWLAEVEVTSGEEIANAVIKAINDAKAVIVDITANSIGSRWVNKELHFAYDLCKQDCRQDHVVFVVDSSCQALVDIVTGTPPSDDILERLLPSDALYKKSWRSNAAQFMDRVNWLSAQFTVCGFDHNSGDDQAVASLPLVPVQERLDALDMRQG